MIRRTKKLALAAAFAVIALGLAGCTSTGATGSGEAAEYPTDMITLLVPGSAGSSNDSIARQLVSVLEAELGQTIVVENFPTEIQGMAELKHADPDGYTIALAPQATASLIPLTQETGFAPGSDDFDVIAQTDSSPVVLLVAADSPYETLDDLVSAKTGISIAAPSGKGVPAVDIELLAQISGLDYDYIGFPPGEQIVAVLNGTTDAALSQTPLAAQYVAEGDLRALALFSDVALDGFDAPLAIDEGFDVTVAPTRLFYAPKGVPVDVIEKLAAAIQTAVESDSFVEYAAAATFIPSFLGPADATAALDDATVAAKEIANTLGWIAE